MAENYTPNKYCCVICQLGFECEKPVTVARKGILTLKYSEEHGRNELTECLSRCLNSTPNKIVLVHKNCRRDFTRTRSNIEHDNAPSAKN